MGPKRRSSSSLAFLSRLHSTLTLSKLLQQQVIHLSTWSAAANKAEIQWLSNAERSAYFASREAMGVLWLVLQGDAWWRAVGSIKSLIYSSSVRNKSHFRFGVPNAHA
ncbi:hypothetical protein ACJRO7_010074 [Eucalyptus globulus]|uniref:Uncharacterized protein n=1 Tax=Eucalyptus globulus TaxID=34317 RepID=A0ABD3LED7_EUCGL